MVNQELRDKTIRATAWNLIEKLGVLGMGLIINIILARLLSPTEYGLIGNIAIFTVIANTFLDSGFGASLIQKQKTNQTDYSTIFFFNLGIGIVLYGILFSIAPWVSGYFQQPILKPLLRVVGLMLIFNSFGLIQSTLFTKHLNFKTQSKAALVSNLLSGVIAVTMAYLGFGVWSLAVQLISAVVFKTALLWYFSDWRPTRQFSFQSLRSLFGFGSNILFSSLLENIYQSAFSWIINKRFSIQSLGFYTQAKKLQEIPVLILSNVIGGVTFPAMATIQDDNVKLKQTYKKILQLQVFVNFPIMLGLMVMAKPVVAILLTAKWLPSVPFIQLLALAGMLYTLQTTNLNILKVKGRSDLYLKLEFVKKIIGVAFIVIGLFWGIYGLIVSLVVSAYVSYLINSYYSGKLISYPVAEQLLDLAPYLLSSLVMAAAAYSVKLVVPFGDVGMLLSQATVAAVTYFLVSLLLRLDAINELKLIAESLYKKTGNGK
mgnify:CR=1 FL=1|jgi:Membrane protein involved in the export of O-antigen and teichoic acid